jgi:signal transduction histidine kinase
MMLLAEPLNTFINEGTTAPFLGMMVAMYSVGRYESGRVAAAATVAMMAAIYVSAAATGDFDASQLAWVVVLGGGPALIGHTLYNRTQLQVQLRARAEQLEQEREGRAETAVEDERARLAAELQVAVANGVSAMVVQASAAARVIAAGEPDRAAAPLALVEETGREALAEMRRLLGVLRRDDEDGADLAPQPTLADAERLVRRIREAGLEVELGFEGEPAGLPAGVDLAAYRILQEALDAAAGDGAARVAVIVGYGDGELSIDVQDDRPERAFDGDRLAAMRERLGLYGGRIRVESDAEGGTRRIFARVPIGAGA